MSNTSVTGLRCGVCRQPVPNPRNLAIVVCPRCGATGDWDLVDYSQRFGWSWDMGTCNGLWALEESVHGEQ